LAAVVPDGKNAIVELTKTVDPAIYGALHMSFAAKQSLVSEIVKETDAEPGC
jgi:hypothetical protein